MPEQMERSFVTKHNGGCKSLVFKCTENVVAKCVAKFLLGCYVMGHLVFVTLKSENFPRILYTVDCSMLNCRVAYLVAFLALRKIDRNSFTLVSVSGHLPSLFPLQIQPASLNILYACCFSFVGLYKILHGISSL